VKKDRSNQWSSGKFGAGGTLGVWGGSPSLVQRQSPWLGGQGTKPPEAESFFVFGYPREGPFFTSPQNFINHTYFK